MIEATTMKDILERNREICAAWRGPRSICRCGHSGDGEHSHHEGSQGLGKCTARGCGCDQFLWDHFVAALEDQLLSLKGE